MKRSVARQQNKIVAYYRVSTNKQGQSGLGLEAQRATVQRYAEQNGLEVVQEFTEVETGTGRRKRPQFLAAVEATRAHRATLAVAKLDRLGRKASAILALRDSGVKFVVADNPSASELTLGILAVVAEEEARLISERTRAALAAHVARGGKLGTPGNLTAETRQKSNQQRAEEARQRNRQATSLAVALRDAGNTLQSIADTLQRDGFETAQGGRWTPTAVRRLLVRQAMGA